MGPTLNLLGCEYLGGCPSIGARVLNKVELHFDRDGLTVAVATQGLFTPAAAHPVLTAAWSEMTALSTVNTHPKPNPVTFGRVIRRALNIMLMRLDLADRLTIGTVEWSMTLGVRVKAEILAQALGDLLAGLDGAAPAVTTS